jgi:transcription termination factor Rho
MNEKAEARKETIISGGILDLVEGYGFLRTESFRSSSQDIYISQSQIRRFGLRQGDMVRGQVRPPKDNEKYFGLLRIEDVNGLTPDQIKSRPAYDFLEANTPNDQLDLSIETTSIPSQILIQISTLKFGQFALIVSSSRIPAHDLIKSLANAISTQHPSIHVFVFVVAGRSATISDMIRSLSSRVVSTKNGEEPQIHIQVAELLMEHTKRLVEAQHRVVVLIDSASRLAQNYQLAQRSSETRGSVGFSHEARLELEKLIGIAGNFRNGGGLTIIATFESQTGMPAEEQVQDALLNLCDVEIDITGTSLTQKNTSSQLLVSPLFGEPYQQQAVSDVFVIMPFLPELKQIYEDHIKPIVKQVGLTVQRGDDFFKGRSVIQQVWTAILRAKLVIADCTGRNANVFYEVGIAHTLGKPVILITQAPRGCSF